MGACEVGSWVGEQKPLGKTLLGGNPSPEMTYLPTCLGGYWGPGIPGTEETVSGRMSKGQ